MNRILLRSPNWVGDALLTTPAVHSIRRHLPNSQITVLARPWVASLFQANPDVDKVLVYQKPGIHQGMGGKWRLARELKAQGFDCVVHFPHSFESAWISFLSRIPVRIGYATEGRSLLLTHSLGLTQARQKEHQVPFFFISWNLLGFMKSLPLKKILWTRRFLCPLKIRPRPVCSLWV
jgi:heptosyltransferase-2